jgi:hypothetical protein
MYSHNNPLRDLMLCAHNNPLCHQKKYPSASSRAKRGDPFLNPHTLLCMDCRAAFQAARNDGGERKRSHQKYPFRVIASEALRSIF